MKPKWERKRGKGSATKRWKETERQRRDRMTRDRII